MTVTELIYILLPYSGVHTPGQLSQHWTERKIYKRKTAHGTWHKYNFSWLLLLWLSQSCFLLVLVTVKWVLLCFQILDNITLTNLDILPTGDTSAEGTLLERVDHCSTPFGTYIDIFNTSADRFSYNAVVKGKECRLSSIEEFWKCICNLDY